MRRRRDVFVDHHVAAAPAVVVVGHLFAEAVLEVVGRPGLPLGNVVVQAALEREEAAAVGLAFRFRSLVVAPFTVGLRVALVEHFGLQRLEIVAHSVDRLLQLGRFLCPVAVLPHVAEAVGLPQHQRQVGHQVVSVTLLEPVGHRIRPVRSFELHRIGEERTDAARERPDPFLDRVGHVVEVFLHHIFFHVVDERAVASRGAVDHPGEIVHLDQRIEIVVACWNVDADQVVIFLAGEVPDPVERGERVGDQRERQQLERAAVGGRRRFRVGPFENAVGRGFVHGGAGELHRIDHHHLRPVFVRHEIAAVGPAGADHQIAGHAEPVRFVEGHLHHVDPLVAEPLERRDTRVVGILRKPDGVDLHAADVRLFQQTQFAHQLVRFHLVAVPPPPCEGAVADVRVAELAVDVAVEAELTAGGLCGPGCRSRLRGGFGQRRRGRGDEASGGQQGTAY